MDLFLLGGTALIAFGLAAVPVLLWAALKRNSELRGALADAQDRLDLLEGRAGANGRGAFVWSQRVMASLEAPTAAAATTFASSADPEPSEFASIAQHRRRGSGPFSPTAALMAFGASAVSAAALVAARMERIDSLAGAALSLAACSAALIGAEWLNHVRHKEMPRSGIAALTAFALFAAAASAWFAAADLAFPQLLALLVHAAAVFAALLYSRRYGWPMLALALTGALSAPALASLGVNDDNPPAALGFLAAALGAIIWMARQRRVLAWCWIAAAGALAWGGAAALGANSALEVASTGGYLAAIATIGLIYASSAARAPLPWTQLWTMRPKPSEPLLTGGAMALVASVVSITLFARAGEAAFWAASSIAVLAGAAAVTAAFAEGLALFALAITTAAIALAFGRWPDEAPIAVSAAILSVQIAIGGWLGVARARDPTPGALLAAFGPLAAMVVAYARVGPLGGAELWAGAAGSLAALNLLFFVRMRTLASGAAAAAIFLAGAGLAGAAGIAFAAPGWIRFPALALLCLALAVADRRFDQRALRFAAAAAAAAALAISLADMRSPFSLQFASWLEPAAPAALAAAGLLYLSARFIGRGQERLYGATAQIVAFCAAGAFAVAVAAQTLRLDGGPDFRLAATGAYSVAALALAAGFALHFGPRPRLIPFIAEAAALACALLLVLAVNGVVLNPWWGLRPSPVYGALLTNELMIAYAAPALGLVLYGWLRARQDLLLRANATSAVGLASAPFWLSLELRRLFHPENMAIGPILPAEGIAITLVWLAFAGSVAWLGRLQSVGALRIAGYLLAFAALAKLAVLDLAPFEGAAKIVGFVLVAAAAIGLIVLFSRRALFGASRMRLDRNLAPPG